MPINATVRPKEHAEPTKKEIKYPCLMRYKSFGKIVLFTDNQTGCLIVQGQSVWTIGVEKTFLDVNHYEPLPEDEEVVLSNSPD